MDRILHPSAIDIGGGRRGFRSKDTVAGVPGTVVTATHLNASQEEIVRAIEFGGDVPDAAKLDQLFRLIRRGGGSYVPTIAGTANALTATLAAAPADYDEIEGARFLIVPSATNTLPTTINFNGLGAIAVKRPDGSPLKPADIIAGVPVIGCPVDGAFWLTTVARRTALGMRYARTANQTISSSVATVMTEITTLVRNEFPGGSYAAGIFTAPFEGWYQATAWLQCTATDRLLVDLYTASPLEQRVQGRDTSPTSDVADRVVSVSGGFYLTVGAQLQLRAIQESGGARAVVAGELSIYYSPS